MEIKTMTTYKASRSDNFKDNMFQFSAMNTGTVTPKNYKRTTDKASSTIKKNSYLFNPGILEIEAVSDSPFVHTFGRTKNYIVSSKLIQKTSKVQRVKRHRVEFRTNLNQRASTQVQTCNLSPKATPKMFEFKSNHKGSENSEFKFQSFLQNTSFFGDGAVIHEKDSECKDGISTNQDISFRTMSPALNSKKTKSTDHSNKFNERIVEANSVDNILKCTINFGKIIPPFVYNFDERTENHTAYEELIETEANDFEEAVKLSSSSGQIISPFVYNFDETAENQAVSKESIEKASKKGNDFENAVKLSCSSISRLKATPLVCKPSASRKSTFVEDDALKLITQNRMSWWSQDETPENFESQNSPNLTVKRQTKPNQTLWNGDSFHKSDQEDIYESDNESKYSSSDDRYRKRYRVETPENWQWKMTYDKSTRSDSKEWIVEKPMLERSIFWRNKFSVESELDDSESSLDDSYRHHRSDSCESSGSESSDDLFSYKNCTRFETPNSSITVEDLPTEFQTGFMEALNEQFWKCDLVKYPDNFFEDIGFTAVLLLVLLYLYQNGEILELLFSPFH